MLKTAVKEATKGVLLYPLVQEDVLDEVRALQPPRKLNRYLEEEYVKTSGLWSDVERVVRRRECTYYPPKEYWDIVRSDGEGGG